MLSLALYWVACSSSKSNTCCITSCSVDKSENDNGRESPMNSEILDLTEKAFCLDTSVLFKHSPYLWNRIEIYGHHPERIRQIIEEISFNVSN